MRYITALRQRAARSHACCDVARRRGRLVQLDQLLQPIGVSNIFQPYNSYYNFTAIEHEFATTDDS